MAKSGGGKCFYLNQLRFDLDDPRLRIPYDLSQNDFEVSQDHASLCKRQVDFEPGRWFEWFRAP